MSAGNRVELSDDRMELVITSPEGHRAFLRSARPGGFAEADVENAYGFKFNSSLEENQVNRARRFSLGSRVVYVHCNVGPPTWWLPRVELRRNKLMVGWLRVLVAISWNARLPIGEQP